MRAPPHSTDRISACALLLGGGVGGVLVSMVALPLAFSSPFPALRKDTAWIIDSPRFNALTATAEAAAAVAGTQPQTDRQPETDGRFTLASLGDQQQLSFAERWNQRVPQSAVAPSALDEPAEQTLAVPDAPSLAPEAAPERKSSPPAPAARETPKEAPKEAPPKRAAAPADPVEQYLWEVYQRRPVKTDSSGDFTWKDQAAAKRLGMSLRTYVIGGMDPDFRETLYHAGHVMDANGLRWSMLSAFRDDYRQGLAAGFKAHGGNSLHGGSRATGGYGHGRAIDITSAAGEDAEPIWHWMDAHGAKYGLLRPMPRIDPAHIQARSSYHDLAHDLREARLKLEHKLNGVASAEGRTKMASRDR